jgi:hypothetical protein
MCVVKLHLLQDGNGCHVIIVSNETQVFVNGMLSTGREEAMANLMIVTWHVPGDAEENYKNLSC